MRTFIAPPLWNFAAAISPNGSPGMWNVPTPRDAPISNLSANTHEKFAGMRIVIEFKYYSNSAFKKLKTTIEDFQLQQEDTRQIADYVEGLKQEYPEARVSQFVIYCVGNQGFRVFEVERKKK